MSHSCGRLDDTRNAQNFITVHSVFYIIEYIMATNIDMQCTLALQQNIQYIQIIENAF